MAFPPDHHSTEKQAHRANERYAKQRAKDGPLNVDLIANYKKSRATWYRQIKYRESHHLLKIDDETKFHNL